MKKQIVRVLLLVLLVCAVVLIHKRVRYEEQEAERIAQTVQQGSEEESKGAESVSIPIQMEEVTLGRIVENEEQGGVDIITANADGTETVHTFTDVKTDSWYVNAVNYVVSAGLMNGSNEKPAFMPDYAIRREFYALLLYRFTGSDVGDLESSFLDVDPSSWYYDAVTWVTNRGILSPADAEHFGVGKYMTCEQAIVGLYRLAGEPETDGSLADYPYAAKVSEFARNAMDWAWKGGLITEKECVWYPPQAISRAQIALLLMRLSEQAG
ncbi:MAG: S-layer homology domain-containing protein [Oscillospiraceae bacterium]|nr:S-layer homology domain-containing protein [Oscillospiraceae bacterium]